MTMPLYIIQCDVLFNYVYLLNTDLILSIFFGWSYFDTNQIKYIHLKIQYNAILIKFVLFFN